MEKLREVPHYGNGLTELRNNLKNMLPADALNVFDSDATSLQDSLTSPLKKKPGDKAPGFELLNALGEKRSLAGLLDSGKVILVFYRGTWCPYCNLQLAQYQQAMDHFKELGAQLVAISPQDPDNSLSIAEKNNLDFEVLSDPGNQVAKEFTTIFKYADTPLELMSELGIDFHSHYADDSEELPVPAVFIIDQDGTIKFAESEGGDYRNRVESQTIINALKDE